MITHPKQTDSSTDSQQTDQESFKIDPKLVRTLIQKYSVIGGRDKYYPSDVPSLESMRR